jgi:plastocyanin
VRLAAIAGAAVVMAGWACASGGTKTAISKAPTPSNAQEVVIYDYKFIPFTMTVRAGATVTWVNYDVAPHTATHRSFSDEPFDSGNMLAAQIFRHTFRKPGTYDYLCILHQGMRGTVVVE